MLITVLRDKSNDDNRFKRINVRKLTNINSLSLQNFEKLTLEISNTDYLDKLSKLISKKGDTKIKIKVNIESKKLIFELENKRKIDKETLKIIQKEPYLKRISY